MLYFRRSRFIRFVILPLTLTVWVSACTSRVVIPPPYESSISEEPGTVMVTLDDGSRIKVYRPWIEADSLVGIVYDTGNRAYTDTVHVALEDIVSVEGKKPEALKTVGLVLLIPLVALSVAQAIVAASCCDFTGS